MRSKLQDPAFREFHALLYLQTTLDMFLFASWHNRNRKRLKAEFLASDEFPDPHDFAVWVRLYYVNGRAP
jgi:hypothetical protein